MAEGCQQGRANSVAVIVQHLVGNLRSRFTDFLTSDGEKPTRQRDQEFEGPTTPAAVPALYRDEAFQSLSIPRGQSQEFNHQMAARS